MGNQKTIRKLEREYEDRLVQATERIMGSHDKDEAFFRFQSYSFGVILGAALYALFYYLLNDFIRTVIIICLIIGIPLVIKTIVYYRRISR